MREENIKMDYRNHPDVKKHRPLLGVRHIQIFLLYTGMIFMSLTKNDMSLAIVAMTDSSLNNTFSWTLQRQSVILSSYKWGYTLSKIPGGVLSTRFGGKVVMVASAVLSSISSLAVPTAAYYGGWQAVCVCRFIQGFATGALNPIAVAINGKWVPVEERARLAAATLSGNHIGIALEYVMAGLLAASWGWPAIFYANGILLSIWTLVYIILGSSSPEDSNMISKEEQLYIQSSLGQTNQKKTLKTPWKAIMTSVPFIILILVHCGQSWIYWTLLTEMPTYISKVLGVNIKSNGLLSSLPYFGSAVFAIVFGTCSDSILAKGWLSVTNCRKLCTSISMYGVAVFLIALSYVTSDVTLAVTLLTIGSCVKSGIFSGLHISFIDIAPNYAGTLMGISGFASNVASTLAPLAVGYIILDETLSSEWQKIFFLSAGIGVVANTIFLMFGSCEKQKWNDIEETHKSLPDSKKQPVN